MGESQTNWLNGMRGWKHTTYGPANSMWWDCPLNEIRQDPSVGFEWFEDFHHFTSTQEGLTSVLTNTGTAAVVTGLHGGQLRIEASDGTAADNDESSVGSTYTFLLPAAGVEIWYEASIKFTEIATDDANIMVGLANTYAHESQVDNGAGPMASYYGACFYKVDGGTTWNCQCSNAAAQTSNTAVATRTSGAFTRLGIRISGLTLATFYINGTAVSSITTNLPTAATGLIFDVKNGGAALETLFVDWFRVAATR